MVENGMLQAGQYLTFKLEDEFFAVDVSKVREVLELSSVTKVPRSPKFLKGVANVRGSVVPVADIRLKFGMKPIEKTRDTRIVVMELELDEELTIIGALADSVHEVMNIPTTGIDPPPRIGMRLKTEFIKGIGKKDDCFIIILDMERIFSTDEMILSESEILENSDDESLSPDEL